MPEIKGPRMFDGELMRKLGINQKVKQVNENSSVIYGSSYSKTEINKLLRIIDEQDAINRYLWINIACDLTSQELERLLYYKGSLIFFYCEPLNKFLVTPYALDGSIDFYARYNYVKPVPFASGKDSDREDDLRDKTQAAILSTMRLKVIKEVVLPEELTYELLTGSAVIIRDYTNQLSQTNIARSILNDELISMMSDCFPLLETNLIMGSGILGVKVDSSDEKDEVKAMAQAVYNAALNKNPYVAMTALKDPKELVGGTRNKPEDYLLAFQSLDNFRLSTYGIANGGVYEKKAHTLESENAINYSTVMSSYEDGLKQRQNSCDIINSIWGLNIWCDASEASLGVDRDGDGFVLDEEKGEAPVSGANEKEGDLE